MTGFTPYSALLGGALIGAAASLLLLLNGRIAGISGILGGLIPPAAGETAWRLAFLLGLPLGMLGLDLARGATDVPEIDTSMAATVVGGLLVGYGTSLGGGCTSGHGVCGLARLSLRSLVAVMTFMLAAMVTVYVWR